MRPMEPITSQDDLDRANIQVAWSMAHRMTDAQFEALCRVSCRALREEAPHATDLAVVAQRGGA